MPIATHLLRTAGSGVRGKAACEPRGTLAAARRGMLIWRAKQNIKRKVAAH